MHENYDEELLLELVKTKQFRALRAHLDEMNEVDIAEFLDELEPDQQVVVFRLLPKDVAADVFTYLEDSEDQEKIINALSDKELREVLDELYLDDTVDIIEDMPANMVSRILRNTDASTRSQINQLLKYPEDSAGSIMTTEFIYLHPNATVEESFARIRKVGLDKETVYTCYVVESNRLQGVVSARNLLLADPKTPITEIMDDNLVTVKVTDDQEFVAREMQRYDFTAMPVVDNEGMFVGIITIDDAIDVLTDESTEDMQKMAAILPADEATTYFGTSVWTHAKQRIPWLLILMLSATFTGAIITHFENALAAQVVLTAFIPMLMDTGGNCGSQSSVTVIRGLSLGEIKSGDWLRVMGKELQVGLLCGGTLAAVNMARLCLLGSTDFYVALAVSLTLIVTVTCAKLLGCCLPILASRLKLDPAVMASPLITTIADAVSLFVYFRIAVCLLKL